jgi:hypothetical protein
VSGREAVERLYDGGLELAERRMIAAIEGLAFGELPEPFDQV